MQEKAQQKKLGHKWQPWLKGPHVDLLNVNAAAEKLINVVFFFANLALGGLSVKARTHPLCKDGN
jgi:hypothetical protein